MEKAVGTTFLVIGGMILSALLYGLTLQVLWGWFVVPTFHAPTLSVAEALGLALIVGYLTKDYTGEDKGKAATGKGVRQAFYERLIKAITIAVFALLCGWVYHLFL